MTKLWTTAAAAALAMTAAGAWAAEPSQQDLLSQVNELKAKVAALETRTTSTADMSATIDSVLRDAEKRGQFLSAGDAGAGYDKGFFIKGDNFELRPGLQFQFRNVTNYAEDGKGDDNDEIQNGFEIRRMKLSFEGYAFTKALTYSIVWISERDGGNVRLEDAVVQYMFSDQWGLKVGQFKDPVHHEELVSSKRQMAVDRTMVNELLGGGLLDRPQGAGLVYKDDAGPVQGEVIFHDGFNSDNTNYQDGATDWGIAGRVEYKVMGAWKDYKDFTGMKTTDQLLVVGAGADYTQGDDLKNLNATVDAQYKQAGLGLYAAVLMNSVDNGEDFMDLGGLVQASFMVDKQLEVFARYDIVVLDDDRNADEDTLHEITAGINYYLGTDGSAGHNAKVTLDLTWLPNGAPSISGLGIVGTEENQIVVRGQFQLLL